MYVWVHKQAMRVSLACTERHPHHAHIYTYSKRTIRASPLQWSSHPPTPGNPAVILLTAAENLPASTNLHSTHTTYIHTHTYTLQTRACVCMTCTSTPHVCVCVSQTHVAPHTTAHTRVYIVCTHTHTHSMPPCVQPATAGGRGLKLIPTPATADVQRPATTAQGRRSLSLFFWRALLSHTFLHTTCLSMLSTYPHHKLCGHPTTRTNKQPTKWASKLQPSGPTSRRKSVCAAQAGR